MVCRTNQSQAFSHSMTSTHVLLDSDSLELPAGRFNQSIIRERFSAQEDIEHKGDSFEAEQVISAVS